MADGQSQAAWHPPGAISAGTNERLEDLHPEGARALARLGAAAWEVAGSSLLELCGVRVAQLLGNERALNAGSSSLDARKVEHLGDWDTSSLFTQAERAHLEFTEQFVTS